MRYVVVGEGGSSRPGKGLFYLPPCLFVEEGVESPPVKHHRLLVALPAAIRPL